MAWMSVAYRNRVLDASLRGAGLPVFGVKLSLHTGDPGVSGTSNEVAGGSYVRKAITHNAASAGSSTIAATVSFTGMPACTVSYCGYWTDEATPMYMGGGALTAAKNIGAGDTYNHTVDTLDLNL